MNLDDFDRVNKEVSKYTKEIYYHIIGDPLVLSNLGEYIKISSKYNLVVNITTSGFFLDKNKFEILTNKSIKQINFSINSFNANSPTLSLPEYLKPIFDFCRYKQKAGNKQFVNLRLWNLDKDKSDYEFNKQVFAYVNTFFNTSLDIDKIYEERPLKIRIDDKVLFNFDEYFEWPSLENKNYGQNGFCYGLSAQLGIHNDGKVVPCCLDKDGIIDLGNILDKDLDEILASNRAKDIIEGFKQGKVKEELCQKCSYRDRF